MCVCACFLNKIFQVIRNKTGTNSGLQRAEYNVLGTQSHKEALLPTSHNLSQVHGCCQFLKRAFSLLKKLDHAPWRTVPKLPGTAQKGKATYHKLHSKKLQAQNPDPIPPWWTPSTRLPPLISLNPLIKGTTKPWKMSIQTKHQAGLLSV